MLVFCRAPKNVARVNLQLRTALDLGPADAFGHDQRLTGGMRMPRCSRARCKMDDRSAQPRGLWPLKLARNGRLAAFSETSRITVAVDIDQKPPMTIPISALPTMNIG